MTPTFKSGQVVYDKQGNPAVYEREVHGGHVVFPQVSLGWGDDDFMLDRTKWPEVFANPPAPSLWPMIILGACLIVVLAVGALS
jgi:hypothetical protein